MSPLRMPRPTRRRGTDCFWFRRRLHEDERPFVLGRALVVHFPATLNDKAYSTHVEKIGNEINFSLRTRDRATAEARHGLAMAHIRSYFAALKAGQRQLTQKQIVALSGEIYRLFVDRFKENPGVPETWAAVKAVNRAAREGRLLPRMTSLKPTEVADAREIVSDLFPDLTAGINALARTASDEVSRLLVILLSSGLSVGVFSVCCASGKSYLGALTNCQRAVIPTKKSSQYSADTTINFRVVPTQKKPGGTAGSMRAAPPATLTWISASASFFRLVTADHHRTSAIRARVDGSLYPECRQVGIPAQPR